MHFPGKGSFLSSALSFFDRLSPLMGAAAVGMAFAALLGGLAERRLIPMVVDAQVNRVVLTVPGETDTEDLERERQRELRSILDKNPFGVSIKQEVSSSAGSVGSGGGESTEERVFSVDGIKVVGSLPDVAAWLSEQDKVSLVLLNQTYGGFLLKEILPYSVILSKENVNYQVYISYRDQGKEASSSARKAPPSEAPVLAQGNGESQVKAAGDGTEGVVARELVDSLLMNPFEELKKIRLIPKFIDGAPVGIEVANIMDGSVLKELGVEKGDVVKSVNGVVIRNMGDVANAINSLMGGSRFEVSVGRGEQEVMLNYVVK